jgi:hypothetical protein
MNQLSAAMAPGGSLTTPFTADMMAKYSPAYQFQLQQGTQAANRAAAASGLTGAGGTAKALQRYTQDYAGTAFKNANDIYAQQQRDIYGRLAGVAGMGETAATTAGQAGQQAAEFGANLTTGAAGTAGQWGIGAAQQAGGWNINAQNLASQNTLSAANYLANTQIGGQQAIAQGDLGAASSWNNMLSGIGSAANSALMLGMGPGGWSFGNMGTNISNAFASGGRGGGGSGSNFSLSGAYPAGFPGPQYGEDYTLNYPGMPR